MLLISLTFCRILYIVGVNKAINLTDNKELVKLLTEAKENNNIIKTYTSSNRDLAEEIRKVTNNKRYEKTLLIFGNTGIQPNTNTKTAFTAIIVIIVIIVVLLVSIGVG